MKKPDIWAEREWTLAAADGGQPVVALIKQGAEQGGSENFTLIHPKKTGEMVKR
jgi:hypothetical protein